MQAKRTQGSSPGQIAQLITADPGLPRSAPTQSYWQSPAHALSTVKSSSLPQYTDVAIIGSGVTGASLSKTLLERDPNVRVVVFEARKLCSGATGRNGGQLATNACESYAMLKHYHGREHAGEIVQFTLDTLARMRELAMQYGPSECEFQETQKVRAFLDQTQFDEVRESLAQLEGDHPRFKGIFSVVAKDRLTDYGVHQGVGAIVHPAGTIWPYRLITRVFQDLFDTHRYRYLIETETPVTSISVVGESDQTTTHPYRIHTPRGIVQAKQVIHCTNGYAGHLVPGLRGGIFPVCGSMTVQDLRARNISSAQSPPPPNGHRFSWAVHYPPHRDPQTDTIHDGLYYLAQSARSQLFYFGGDNAGWADSLNADDRKTVPTSVETLRRALPAFLCPSGGGDGHHSEEQRQRQIVAAWSGVMGFSSDGLPLVGRLPASVTGRPEADGEWAAVAFNGYGMANCWLAGEALGMMVLGKDISGLLPEPYVINPGRLEQSLSVQRSVDGLVHLEGDALGQESKL
ncbi:FAD dependent oxidoreductase [Aspergillus germanicus]